MKDVVTFETAKALKEAGFPQPQPEPGQVWWFKRRTALGFRGQAHIVVVNWKDSGLKFIPIDGGKSEAERVCFAPTATGILRELGKWEISILWNYVKKNWFCDNPEDLYGGWLHTNPAEAAAAAWLEINRKEKLASKL